MNIRAIWTDPDYSYGKKELVNIIKLELVNGIPTAWVITKFGSIEYRYVKDLEVIDKEYMS